MNSKGQRLNYNGSYNRELRLLQMGSLNVSVTANICHVKLVSS